MTRQEHLLTIISEECGEVSQRCSKALRFGMDEIEPGQADTNAARILQEFNDLVGAVEMLFGIRNVLNSCQIEAKKRKVQEYLAYSEKCGTLTTEAAALSPGTDQGSPSPQSS